MCPSPSRPPPAFGNGAAGGRVFTTDALREPVRLGAGLTADKYLDETAQTRAIACLERFGERLRGFDPHAVRALGTNTLRVATVE